MRRSCYAVLSLTLLMLPDFSAGQEPTNQLLRQLRQEDRVLSPALEVREFSGEFERWSKAITVTAPGIEVFRWSTPASGTISARWSVMDGPSGSGASVLGSGSAGSAPEPGSVTAFRIDFGRVIPAERPTAGKTYWVVLEPIDAARQAGPLSAPVQITYAGQVDIGAFAGREADIVAPPQADLSKTSKLAFLRDLLGGLADLPAAEAEDLGAAAAAGNMPDAEVRLTPREPVVLIDGNSFPHVLEYEHSYWVHHPNCVAPQDCTGEAAFPQSGRVRMTFQLSAGRLYLLDIGIFDVAGLPFELTSECQIDGLQQKKTFPAELEGAHRLAVVAVPPHLSYLQDVQCSFLLFQASVPTDEPDPTWGFYSAELTALPAQ